VLEVEPTGRRGHVAIRNGQTVVDAEKLTSSVSRTPSAVEPRLLLKVNRKSKTTYSEPEKNVAVIFEYNFG